MKLVNESLNEFQRGKDIKDALDVGNKYLHEFEKHQVAFEKLRMMKGFSAVPWGIRDDAIKRYQKKTRKNGNYKIEIYEDGGILYAQIWNSIAEDSFTYNFYGILDDTSRTLDFYIKAEAPPYDPFGFNHNGMAHD